MSVRRAHKNKDLFKIEMPTNIIPIRADEPTIEQLEKAAGAETVTIDIHKMNRNTEKRKKQEE